MIGLKNNAISIFCVESSFLRKFNFILVKNLYFWGRFKELVFGASFFLKKFM